MWEEIPVSTRCSTRIFSFLSSITGLPLPGLLSDQAHQVITRHRESK